MPSWGFSLRSLHSQPAHGTSLPPLLLHFSRHAFLPSRKEDRDTTCKAKLFEVANEIGGRILLRFVTSHLFPLPRPDLLAPRCRPFLRSLERERTNNADCCAFDPLPISWTVPHAGWPDFINEHDARASYAQLYAHEMRKVAEESSPN